MTPGPILAATDFGARADRAVDRALMLGKQLQRDVALAHALDFKPEQSIDYAALDKKMASVLPEPDCDRVRFHYPEGSPPSAIAELAEAENAGIIVLGVARYNSLGDYFLGTAVDYVIRNTTRPVLVVKARAREDYRDIVVGTDFSSGSKFAFEQAAKLFPDATFHVVHGYQVPFKSWNRAKYVDDEVRGWSQDELDSFVASLDIDDAVRGRMTSALVRGNSDRAVNEEVERFGAQLVVVGSHGESGFRQAAIGSMTSALLLSTPVDTLVVNVANAPKD